MPSIAKSNSFTAAVVERIKNDSKFKCGRSYADLLVWTRLCAPLTNSEIFSYIPLAVRNAWTDQEACALLLERGAPKADRFNLESLAANLVCFRRNDTQSDEIASLRGQVNHLSSEFNSLSNTVFDILSRLTVLEEENRSLKTVLLTQPTAQNAAGNDMPPCAHPACEPQSPSLATRSDKDAVTKYVL